MDKIFDLFLRKQYMDGMALAAASDILELRALGEGGAPPQRYLARYHCHGFVEDRGQITKSDRFDIGIYFPDQYLREANNFEVVTVLGPSNVFHPNLRFPFACLGEFLRPGTKLVEILFTMHAIITHNKWAAHSPLNETAAQWTRANQNRVPADRRPLKRRALDLQISLSAGREQS
jgi:hypothetical protein